MQLNFAAGLGWSSVTAEPRMEDLLASIRKAIHDDIGEVPSSTSGQSAGTLYKNSMRELHVKVGEEASNAAAEIQELREKINRTRAADIRRDYTQPPVMPPPQPVFETESRRPSWRAPEPAVTPPLRQSLAEQDLRRLEIGRRDFSRRLEREIDAPPQQSAWPDVVPAAVPQLEQRLLRDNSLLAPDVEAATGAAFSRLADSILNRATGERSIEDMTRELLRGMLKQWLDDNLPGLVERLVREEIERVARRGR